MKSIRPLSAMRICRRVRRRFSCWKIIFVILEAWPNGFACHRIMRRQPIAHSHWHGMCGRVIQHHVRLNAIIAPNHTERYLNFLAMRAKSLSSSSPPVMSGKSSPCPSFSGKSSPCSTADDTTKSQHKKLMGLICGPTVESNQKLVSNPTSPRSDKRPLDCVQEVRINHDEAKLCLNENEIIPTIVIDLNNTKPQNATVSDGPVDWNDLVNSASPEMNDSDGQDNKCDQYSQTDLEDDNLTLEQWRDKYERNVDKVPTPVDQLCNNVAEKPVTSVDITVDRLNRMENAFLSKQLAERKTLENCENRPIEINKVSEVKKPAATTPAPLKYSSVLNRNVGITKTTTSTSLKTVQPVRSATRVRQPLVKSATNPAVSTQIDAKKTLRSATVQNIPKSGATTKSSTIASSTKVQTVSKRRENVVPSHVANRLSARSKTMIEISNRNINKVNSVQLKLKPSSKDCDSSSSTLKASNERVGSSSSSTRGSVRNLTQTNDRRSEPKSMQKSEDNDGWLTVKARRRSSLHWANRFDQPTGYASLPSLALDSVTSPQLNSLSEEKADKVKKDSKKINNKTEKPEQRTNDAKSKQENGQCNGVARGDKPKLVGKSAATKNTSASKPITKPTAKPTAKATKTSEKITNPAKAIISRENIIQRQKSDLTGLKITSLHREYLRKEKINHREQQKLASSSSSMSSGSPKQTSELQCGDANLVELCNTSVDMKIQTNMGLTKTISDLYFDSRGQDDFSSDETEDKDDVENDEDQRKLFEEQESLERQIRELENTEIDVDTETDETDCDAILGLEENESGDFSFDENMSLEMRYQSLLSDMTVGERDETLATLQLIVSRHPGRAQELHQKLSSPSRRRSLHETLKKYQVKQARAHDKREALNKEKSVKIQLLLARVEDVKEAKQKLIDEKRMRMEKRLQKAEDNRNQYLKDKIRKAHDEEEKLKEIAFIKNLERENKKLDFMESLKEQEGRLQDLEQERQKRVEEKAAKEAAVERRRLELELERKKKLEKMDETRREREQRIGQMQEQKEKMRQQIARDKARDREERLQALQAQQQQKTEELQRKIIQNQQESARRHEENIEQIRQRAVELSIPSRNTDDNGPDRSDGGDLSSVVSDVSREQLSKGSKKKFKKLKQRMQSK